MHPITLLAVFIMVVVVQAAIWAPKLVNNESNDVFFEKYFQFFYALGTHDVAWGDIFNLDSKTLKIFTDKEIYKLDEKIVIKGSVRPYEKESSITLAISDEKEKIIFLDYIIPNKKGIFTKKIPISDLVIDNSNKFSVFVYSGLDKSSANFVIAEEEDKISFDKIMQQIMKENRSVVEKSHDTPNDSS